jgi:hypothetical protein
MNLAENLEKPVPGPNSEGAPNPREQKEAGPETEQSPQPEQAAEESPTEESAVVQATPVKLPDQPTVSAKDAYHQRLERLLEDNLVDLYLQMPKAQRQQFRAEGERVASQLRQMIETAKIKAKQVLEIIRNWLKSIPGVSRYFLEQESKIKTDRVIRLAEERRKEKEGEV